jgi:hypothetical protein
VLENIKYNVTLNSNTESEEYSDEETALREAKFKMRLPQVTRIRYLNWDEVTPPYEKENLNDRRNDVILTPFTSESTEGHMSQQISQEFLGEIPQADIIIGSELTYTPKSVEGLIKTVKTFLKRDGVFYEVLSTDRDGVPLFLERMQEEGWLCEIRSVPQQFLGNYGTGQRFETYCFYTFKVSIFSRTLVHTWVRPKIPSISG